MRYTGGHRKSPYSHLVCYDSGAIDNYLKTYLIFISQVLLQNQIWWTGDPKMR